MHVYVDESEILEGVSTEDLREELHSRGGGLLDPIEIGDLENVLSLLDLGRADEAAHELRALIRKFATPPKDSNPDLRAVVDGKHPFLRARGTA